MNPVAEALNLEQLKALSPEELLGWAYREKGPRTAIMTSFQKTGCVMIDMAYRKGAAEGIRVVTVDTLRLHDETYDLIKKIESRYGIEVETYRPHQEKVRQMVEQHGEYLFFDSKEKQEHCCHLRKVEPNNVALESLDIWITGLRKDQSNSRKSTEKAEKVIRGGREILKLSPLADWSEKQVDQYIKENDVPYNALYDQGYASIGCVICTTPIQPGEDKRAGRWRWFNQMGEEKKECGIHIGGSGI
jgi:phosphoadenylyl-sulfate reductase (thioredoxin)